MLLYFIFFNRFIFKAHYNTFNWMCNSHSCIPATAFQQWKRLIQLMIARYENAFIIKNILGICLIFFLLQKIYTLYICIFAINYSLCLYMYNFIITDGIKIKSKN